MRTYYTAVVVGDPPTACKAATDRGIRTWGTHSVNERESIVTVPETEHDRLARWLTEPGSAPFPPGTCLVYSAHKAVLRVVVQHGEPRSVWHVVSCLPEDETVWEVISSHTSREAAEAYVAKER
jgi:uncharacterized protein YbdZ (MbtH family)